MSDKPYRKAVVAVFYREDQKVLLGKRSDTGSWQFPQGGIDPGESSLEALKREMLEEIGCDGFNVLKESSKELSYDFPPNLKARVAHHYKGQSQKWYLCSLKEGHKPDLKKATCDEFIALDWFEPSFALSSAVDWKKKSYQQALEEFELL